MAEPKTKMNDASVEEFINQVPNEQRRQDSLVVLELMKQVTGAEPKMWGDSIVGFGSQHYIYASGREGDWPLIGFSPRKQNLTLYLSYEYDKHHRILARLGKHKTSKACLYINKLKDIDLAVLKELVEVCLAEASDQNSPGD